MDDINIDSLLDSIPPSELNYQDWVNVGMALKHEGYDCSIWDAWSRKDSRYHSGECDRKWKSFNSISNPVTMGTLVHMAAERGWRSNAWDGDGCIGWNDPIEYDGDFSTPAPAKNDYPSKQLITYIKTLFNDDDYVGYVTNDCFEDEDGKWKPKKGVFHKKAKEIINDLERHPEDIGYAIGDPVKEAGAWIRFNPLDGKGAGNDNVTAFRFALVESDSMPVGDQYKKYIELKLPIACMVSSGGKSIHAIVRVDAANREEYEERVSFLYNNLMENGIEVDKQNKNPSRLSRMPGIMRGEKEQTLLAVNIGKPTWEAWYNSVLFGDDSLPEFTSFDDYPDGKMPELPEALIDGILRRGHKMLISGSSKAGKSFLLIELAAALAEGKEWLGFKCKKSKVLYINLEIDGASFTNRVNNIYNVLGYEKTNNLVWWNMRGNSEPLNQLVPKIIHRCKGRNFDAIIVDPIYKVIMGDENNASDMAGFCNQFDVLANELNCSVIYCHHHSKGAQGSKRAIDRASGSGVFARDPDAQLDMIELVLTDHIRNNLRDGCATAWRMESSLREFKNIDPVNFWFEYPIHRVDNENLAGLCAEGSTAANLDASGRKQGKNIDDIKDAIVNCSFGDPCTVKDIMSYFEGSNVKMCERTLRSYLNENPDIFERIGNTYRIVE